MKRSKQMVLFLVCQIMLLCGAESAYCGLLGSSVTGSLTFGLNPTNFFDPVNGGVPAGFGNVGGTTVVIQNGPPIEFGYDDGANIDTADFTDTQLIIGDQVLSTAINLPWTMKFTSSAFVGASLSLPTGNFPGAFLGSLSGDMITVTWDGGAFNPIPAQPFQATFNVTQNPTNNSVPEPASLAMWSMVAVGIAIGAARRRRQKLNA